jgi:GT2 family glycosyltransferase
MRRSVPCKLLFYLYSEYTVAGWQAYELPLNPEAILKQVSMPDQIVSTLYPLIVNWNLARDTIACVHSLLVAGATPGQIIVVDNGSSDGSVETLRQEVGDAVTLLTSPQNLGFAGGNNLALRHALSRGARWLMPINNDTIVAPDFLNRLSAAIDARPDFHLFGPLIFYHDEPERIWSLGDRLLPGTLLTRSLWRDQMAPAHLPPFLEVDFVNACCFVVQRAVLERVGLFDARFFMYAEDADFCWRVRRAGFHLGCCTEAHMWHKVSRSTGIHHPQRRYWRISNQILFYRRYANTWQRPLMFGFTLLRSSRMALADLLHGRGALAQRTLQAWVDGWFSQPDAPLPNPTL